jgi:hypothetical protein
VVLGGWLGELVEVGVLRLGEPSVGPADLVPLITKLAPNDTEMMTATAMTVKAIRGACLLLIMIVLVSLCRRLPRFDLRVRSADAG